jgi:hypothetical protein
LAVTAIRGLVTLPSTKTSNLARTESASRRLGDLGNRDDDGG